MNINYVHGLGNEGPQTWMPPDWYFTGMIVIMPLAIYLPSHLVFAWLFGKRPEAADGAWAMFDVTSRVGRTE